MIAVGVGKTPRIAVIGKVSGAVITPTIPSMMASTIILLFVMIITSAR